MNKNQIHIIGLILASISLLSTQAASALTVIGTLGATYQIAEKDALSAMESKAKEKDWKQVFSDKKTKSAILSFKPDDLQKLPAAKESRSFRFKMEYILEFDITDDKGNIIYPKGFLFNPLEYVTLPNTLVVIDGTDKKQVTWFKQSEYRKDFKVMLLITDGKYSDLIQDLKIPVFYANSTIVGKFRLQVTPSVIRQDQSYLEVSEIEIKSNK